MNGLSGIMRVTVAGLIALGLGCCLGAQAQVNQEAIDAVASGERTIAWAAWWGFDRSDATRTLQSAIDSGAKKVIVENMGAPWIVDKIQLASNQEIVFADGVIVEAKKGAFKGGGDCLFTASLKEKVTLTGYGATFRMHRADYDGPDYEKAEWRHVLSIRSCRNVCVHGLTLAESGGDGIYLGVAQEGVTNTRVHIKDVVCDRNHRQGISVISAEELFIENCILRDTAGTPPMAGIDFEPNRPTEKLVKCVMRNCVVENNQGDGYEFYLKNLHGDSDDVSIRIENCKSIGDNRAAVRIVTTNGHPDGDVGGLMEFVNCTFERPGSAGIMITEKPASGCRVRFVNCSILRPAADTPAQSPIVLGVRPGDTKPIGGVELVDCVVADPIDRPVMTLHDWAGSVRVADVTGTLILERDGERTVVPITPERLAEWMPTLALKDIPPFDTEGVTFRPHIAGADPARLAAPSARLRKQALLLLYAEKGDEVAFTIRYGQLARYSGRPMPVRIVSPSGEDVKTVTAAFLSDTPATFTAPETGVFAIRCDTGQNTVQVLDASHPMCITSEAEPVHLLRSEGDLFFWVPADTRRFAVKAYGDNAGEGVRAALYDASGKLVEERDKITRPYQFVVKRQPAERGEVWRLRLAKATDIHLEDHYVQLQGIPPLMSWTPEGLLIPGQPIAP
ncbi:MAG: right-handed parallel beta-helix repeat-containing protein [Armatimonadota bacterium]